VSWQDKKSNNTEVLQLCSDISGIEAFLTAAEFHRTGHVVRMNDDKLPKVIFYTVNSRMEHAVAVVNDSGAKTCSRPV